MIMLVCTASLAPKTMALRSGRGRTGRARRAGRREDLIGKEVAVDDHVSYYVPRNGTEPDELQLKRTPITFLVPRRLRPTSSTR